MKTNIISSSYLLSVNDVCLLFLLHMGTGKDIFSIWFHSNPGDMKLKSLGCCKVILSYNW